MGRMTQIEKMRLREINIKGINACKIFSTLLKY